MTTAQPLVPAASGPDLYGVHPFLDPKLPSRRPAIARLWLSTYRKILKDPGYYAAMLHAYAQPAGRDADSFQALHRCFRDADTYLDDLLRLVPEGLADQMAPQSRTRRTNDTRKLLKLTFEGTDSRSRYEAQRKLYLAKLLFDVDHCKTVQDGPRHKRSFEALLQQHLWRELAGGRSIEVCCRFDDPEGSEESGFVVGVPPEKGAVCWRFQVRKLPAKNGDPEIEIYHYRSRFKREANPAPGEKTENGFLTLREQPRWPGLGRRSGSIVSKMLRRGIGDPRMVQDLLGAMFIVGNRRQAYALERRLIHTLGGPLRWRDRVDTLAGEKERDRLNVRSVSGFRVLKGIVDVLTDDPPNPEPYFFSVEVQIFPLENYIRTLHARHFASHYAYKKRQFLHDLLPMLFPSEIYGKETAHLAAESR
ncbi:MAG: hypothetical protein ABIK65_08500 [Candidatus Eisenbacteria bacterium]